MSYLNDTEKSGLRDPQPQNDEEKVKRDDLIAKIVSRASEKKKLQRQSWRNWFFLTGILILTTIGLATALPPLISERVVHPWPWIKTDLVLIIGLSMTVILFVGYMTQQQRHVMQLHQKLEDIQTEADVRLKQNSERLYALASMSRIMGAETDIKKIFNAITRICSETFHSDRASLMLIDDDKQHLVVESACGHSSEDIMLIRKKIGEGVAGYVARERKPLILNTPMDSDEHPDLQFSDSSLTSAMVTPIIVRDELVGVMNVGSRSPEVRYEPEDLRALQVLADNAGVCIRHMEHIIWIKKIGPKLKKNDERKKRVKRS